MVRNSNMRDLLDVFSEGLSNPDFQMPAQYAARFQRLKNTYAHWVDNPLLTENRVRDYIMSQFSVGRAQAYNDIAVIKAVFGNVPLQDKEFRRYKANHLLDLAAAAAIAGNDKKAKALTKIAEATIKVNQLDEDEGENYPFEEIVPKDFSFTVDPSVIGIEKEPNIEEKSRKLLKKYTQEIDGDR